MPNPKRRHSKTRTAKRRTHHKMDGVQLNTCTVTGEVHVRHRAYRHDGKLYYRGRVVSEQAL